LIDSPDVKKKFESSAVAITFRWHKGKVVPSSGASPKKGEPEPGAVLHVLGHFKHQRDKESGDRFALQQLLLNFILEKQRANRR
jgi:hypothetical protein